MAKISNKIKIKNEDGTFEDIQISYIEPNGAWAEGEGTVASGKYSHAEGFYTQAIGQASHAEGSKTYAFGSYSHAEGISTDTYLSLSGEANSKMYTINGNFNGVTRNMILYYSETGIYAPVTFVSYSDKIVRVMTSLDKFRALNNSSVQIIYGSYKEGSHTEGYNTIATEQYAHAEGEGTFASGPASHAEGSYTTASNSDAHAEGINTQATGMGAHAEGCDTTASGKYSHSEGYGTFASGEYQHVEGKYNIEDTADQYVHIVGNGTADDSRSNIHTLDWDGNAWFAGDIKLGGTGQDNSLAISLLDKITELELKIQLLENKLNTI